MHINYTIFTRICGEGLSRDLFAAHIVLVWLHAVSRAFNLWDSRTHGDLPNI